MNYQLCGFLIGQEIQLDFKKKRLYRLPSEKLDNGVIFAMVELNETTLHFFHYLLLHAHHKKISKDEILKTLWEEKNLAPSTQRLWKILKDLNRKLCLLGLPENFIQNIRGSGYVITYCEITPLYLRTREILVNAGDKYWDTEDETFIFNT
ncbi:winged helix-turn-helix domain-containing protein [Rahnella selenatireducens]|uniref:winged helix-turn-helix domain-containing protein n=1 Tax=Rahnella selenatireducens TaxID=3389797 RepID=UPI0039682BB8